jgi:hypothetical protein
VKRCSRQLLDQIAADRAHPSFIVSHELPLSGAPQRTGGASTASVPFQCCASQRRQAFEILGFYIAQLVAAVAYTVGVERLVLGGGVLKAPGLLEEARLQLPLVTGGPGAGHAITTRSQDFMMPPSLGDFSGLLGAVAAAADLMLPTKEMRR